MNRKKRRQRRNVGDVCKIDLGDGYFAFGRVLEEPLMAFYDLRAAEVPRLEDIVAAPIAFKIWVMNYAITAGDWPILGNVPLSPDLEEKPAFFKIDPITGQLGITYEGAGDERPATFEECASLECAAVWEPEHVVDRLIDYFAGRPNRWVESMRPRRG